MESCKNCKKLQKEVNILTKALKNCIGGYLEIQRQDYVPDDDPDIEEQFKDRYKIAAMTRKDWDKWFRDNVAEQGKKKAEKSKKQ